VTSDRSVSPAGSGAELPGDFTNRDLALHEMMKTSTIGKGELRIAKRHPKNLQGEALVFGMSHLEIECARLHPMSQLFKEETWLAT
jgi:hypothetical protein